jgi:hypothetical protein
VYDNAKVTDQACTFCGRDLNSHSRHTRFRLPDPVLAQSPQGLPDGTWLSHGGPDASVMMHVPGLGAFVRALLPVCLAGGHTVTFGVWVGIRPADLQRLRRLAAAGIRAAEARGRFGQRCTAMGDARRSSQPGGAES